MTKDAMKGKNIIVELCMKSPYWEFDRFGNAKNTGDLLKDQYRFKFQDTSVRFEKKYNDGWINLTSDYYKNMLITESGGLKIGTRVLSVANIFGI